MTAAFVMAGLGAYYLLAREHEEYGKIFVKVGVIAGVIASVWMLFPSGHMSSDQVAEHQPVTPRRDGGALRDDGRLRRWSLSASRTCRTSA